MSDRRRFLIGAGGTLAAVAATKVIAGMRHRNTRPTGQFIDIDGTRLHYKILGESGPKVVIIHGASGNLLDWTIGPALEIAKNNRVLLFDRPGLGFSDRAPKNGSSLSVQAALMRKAALRLGWDKHMLIGHSYGGSVALSWSLDAPETVSSLLLLAAPSHVWPTGPSLRNRIASNPVGGPILSHLAAAFVPQSMIEDSVKSVFAPQSPPDNYAERINVHLVLQPQIIQNNARDVTQLKTFIREMQPRYEELTMPVTMLHGDADKTVDLEIHSIAMSKRLPHAKLEVLKGIGHMPHHVSLSEVLAAISAMHSP